MLRRLALIGAALCVGWSGAAQALGLGEIEVTSNLNQKFSATIPVLSASANDIDSLQVTLASADDFAKAGIERPDYATTLSFKVQPGPRGAVVVISSPEIDREPFLNFLVQARWAGGRLLREYTVLLDPPSLAPAEMGGAPSRSPATAPASGEFDSEAPVVRPGRGGVEPESSGGTVGVLPSYSGVGATQYGPTIPKETLWSIAAKVKAPDATMDQILLALYAANRSAFDHGRFGGLLKGVTLTVPSASEVAAVSPAEAKAAVDALKRGAQPSFAGAPRASGPRAPAAPRHGKPKAETSLGEALSSGPSTTPNATAPATPVPVVPKPDTAPTPSPANPTAPANGTTATPPPATAATPTPTPATVPPPATSVPATTPVPVPVPVVPKAPLATAQPPPPESSWFDGLEFPLIVIVALLLIGFLVWRALRGKRKEEEDNEPIPPIAPSAQVPRLMATGAFATTQENPKPSGMPEVPPEQQTNPTQKRFDQATVETRPFGSDSTVQLAEPPASMEPAKTSAIGGDVDFDLTSQFEAQTLAVNLDANDPLSEADFHLAYGLYDEAAGLLKKGIEREPERTDLRTKLCETYFAAGKSVEFQEAAEHLHGKLAPGEWQKLAIMGRQLCPDSSLFRDEAGGTPSVDLPLGDEPKPASNLDFDLGDFSEERTVMAPKRAAAGGNQVIDFDLDSELRKDGGASGRSPDAGATHPETLDPLVEAGINLHQFDLSQPTQDALEAPKEGTVEFNLDELDLDKPAAPAAVPGLAMPGDEIGTKLDLARAYADMGDNEQARALLAEVGATGSAAQKQEAEALTKRLGSG